MAILMSVIHKNGQVTIATDSSSGENGVRKNPSVRCRNEVLYGWVGDEAFSNFMNYYCPKFKFDEEDSHEYLVTSWRKLYLGALYDYEILSRNGGTPDINGSIHVAYKGCLFEVREDASILHSQSDSLYVGSGSESARFAYNIMKQQQANKELLESFSEEELIKRAVEYARDYGNGIRGPIHILTI